MKILSISIALIGLSAILFFSCKPKPNYGFSEFQLNQEFELGVAKTGKQTPGSLKVTFNGVTEDSRCPEGVNCMWAGKVVASITAANAEGSQTFEFTLEGKSNGPVTRTFKNYKIHLFEISPYPKNDVKIDKQAYKARLKVSK